MDRRKFVKSGVAASVAATVISGCSASNQTATTTTPTPTPTPKPNPSVKPPNILYIFADQHRSITMQGPSAVQADVLTPNLNAFRENGFQMNSCYSNYPLCSPHRAMLQTGIWPQKNGMVANEYVGGATSQQNDVLSLNTRNTTVGEMLQAGADYYTGYVGKWDLYEASLATTYMKPGNLNRFNYNEWMPWFNENNHYVGGIAATPGDNTPVDTSHSAFYVDPTTTDVAFTFPYTSNPDLEKGAWNPHYETLQAQDFINRNKSNNQPWLLFVSYNVPHPPYDPPNGTVAGAQPSNGYDHYNEVSLPAYLPNNDTLANGGTPDRNLNQVRSPNDPSGDGDPTKNNAGFLANASSLAHATWKYYEGVSDVDTEIQTLINAVGNDPNTIIIYSSDHGDMLGSHSLAGKQFPHEESISVPFYVGGAINGKKIIGSYNGLFSSIDIVPTLCGLAGVTPPAYLDGQNFASVITGQATDISKPNQYVFLMNGPGDPLNGNGSPTEGFTGYFACPVYRGLRSARYTYACVATRNLQVFQDTGPNHEEVGPYAGGHWVLYDNQLDPLQQNNLISSNGSYPVSTAAQPVPNFSDLKQALEAFIAQNGNTVNGPDPFTSPVLT